VIPRIEMTASGQPLPPHNLQAEQSVIGSLLLDRDAIIGVSQILQPDDFYADAHRIIYGVIADLYERRQPADYVTLTDELERRDLLSRVGGRGYLPALAADVPIAAHALYYAEIVARLATLRRLIDAGQRIVGIGYDEARSAEDAVDSAEKELFAVAQRRNTHGFASIREVLTSILERLDYVHENRDAVAGVPTGFVQLDKLTGGFQRSDLIILAARPAVGKCVAWDTLVVDPETGERVTIERFVAERRSLVSGMSALGGVETKRIGDWIDSGVKPCFRVRTRTGREVTVTGHHPFFTVDGWKPLHDLTVGDAIAAPAELPVFGSDDSMSEGRIRLLAYFIAEGSLSARKVGFTNTDPIIVDDFKGIIAREFPECAVRQEGITYWVARPRARGGAMLMLPNPVRKWLDDVGAYGLTSDKKYFPDCVWRWPKDRLALFLRCLMSCDGSIFAHGIGGNPRIEFGVASQRLAGDVYHALVRFGVVSTLRQKNPRCWVVCITGRASVERYQREIGWLGEKATRFAGHIYPTDRVGNVGHLPRAAWPMVRVAAREAGLSMVEVAQRAGETARAGKYGGYNSHTQRGLTVKRAREYARVLNLPRLEVLCNPTLLWDEIVEIESVGEQQVYDLTVPDGANFVANDLFVHNTALALSLCHNTAVRYKSRVAIFSLEMSAEQLVQRLLCMEGGLDSARLRTGHITEEEWRRLMQAAAALAETDIYIDDTASISTLEMRSKARRLHSERPLDLVIVDYLQLMQGGVTANENRVQEISKISRDLKGLARELQVPVLSLSQVSRAVDSRADHKPLLSDLRESGCLAGDTPVYLPDQGVYRPISELVGQRGLHVLGVNTRTWQLEPAVVTNAFATGVKPVFKLVTLLGRSIRATANHKFLTIDGWKRLDELTMGGRVVVPRVLPGPTEQTMGDAELALLGHLIGDGCTLPRHTIQYTTRELELAELVAGLATKVFGDAVRPRISQERQWYQVYLVASEGLTHGKRNPITTWLHELGVFGLRSHEKRIPEKVFTQPSGAIALFLRHLWATDGCLHLSDRETNGIKKHYPSVYYASSSKSLCGNVQSLLLRLGVNAVVGAVPQSGKGRDQYHVMVMGKGDIERFLLTASAVGTRRTTCATAIIAHLATLKANTNRDVLPREVWKSIVIPAMAAAKMSTRRMQAGLDTRYCGSTLSKSSLSRERAARLAAVVASAELACPSTSDVYWDEIVSVEPDGEEQVYDITVDELRNFVASDMIAHNSIEQDADVVMFIYRDKIYNPDTEKEHIADLIVAKHRNGPTGQIELFFNESQTRFIDLAPGGAGEGI